MVFYTGLSVTARGLNGRNEPSSLQLGNFVAPTRLVGLSGLSRWARLRIDLAFTIVSNTENVRANSQRKYLLQEPSTLSPYRRTVHIHVDTVIIFHVIGIIAFPSPWTKVGLDEG